MAQTEQHSIDPLQQIDVDDTITRLSAKKGVESVTVMTKDGQVIRTTATAEQAESHGKLLSKLARDAAEIVEQLDDQDELSFLRIRTTRHEVMVALDHISSFHSTKPGRLFSTTPAISGQSNGSESSAAISASSSQEAMPSLSTSADASEIAMQLGSSESSYPLIIQLTQTLLEKLHGGALFSNNPEKISQTLQAVVHANTSESVMQALSASAVPWWAVIGGTAIALRLLLTVPLYIRQQRAVGAAEKLKVVSATWMHAIRRSLKLELQAKGKSVSEADMQKMVRRRVSRKHHELMLKENCHPIEMFLLPLVQMPLWVSMSCAIRHLCGRPIWFLDDPSAAIPRAIGITWEGLGWFKNLADIDPFYVLPVVTGSLHLVNFAVTRWTHGLGFGFTAGSAVSSSTFSRFLSFTFTGLGYTMPFVIAGVSLFQPTALVYYWSVSAAFSLLQSILFSKAKVRLALKLPALSKARS
ncbi:hypothetical protein FB645_004401 [Coemansia sp. IMI 203386]|nr:hypothetical protein FB645_004401 [Coemansia sp. IMI 203386]